MGEPLKAPFGDAAIGPYRMIVLKHCGEIYRADEKHIGYSIRCRVCGLLISITRDAPHSAVSTCETPTVEYIPPQPNPSWVPPRPSNTRRFFTRSWVFPTLGLLALTVGVALSVLSYRSRTNNAVVSQTSATASPSPEVHVSTLSSATRATPINSTKFRSPTSDSSKNISAPQTADKDPLDIDKFLANNPTAAPTAPPQTVRYPTGANLMRPLSTSGRGVLHISNGTEFDAIAKLVDAQSNLTVRLVYIQANTNADIGEISSGDYFVKFALGTGYNQDSGRFLYAQSFAKFDEVFDFHQYRTSDGIEWTDYDISLHPVVGGTARTSRISASEFYDR